MSRRRDCGVVPVILRPGTRCWRDFWALRDARCNVRSPVLERDGQNRAGKWAVHACCLRWAGRGNCDGLRSRAIVAFAYALVSLYWALDGHALVSTIGG